MTDDIDLKGGCGTLRFSRPFAADGVITGEESNKRLPLEDV
jgi:hypothetical protein